MSEQTLIDWLLEAQTPSIRYLTLRDLLNIPEDDKQLQAARAAIRTSGPAPAILARQAENGSWIGEKSFYTPKYTSTHWSMSLLAELAVDENDPGGRKGAEHMLDDTRGRILRRQEEGTHGWTCFWAHLLRYAVHFGFLEDPRVADVAAALAHDGLRAEWRCEHNSENPCAWGAARALWALAAVPAEKRSVEVEATIQRALAFLLEEYDMLRADYPTWEEGQVSLLWSRLSFPLFYQADILVVLRSLAELGRLDHPGAEPVLDWLRKRQIADGRWRGGSPFRGRTWRELGDRQETERWISLQAAWVLSRL
jgi:hypothetical protein